ncbi:MAG: PilN domain-containing protein [Myxococcota bacterium]
MGKWMGIDITDTAVRVAVIRSSLRATRLEVLREERLVDHETAAAALRAATQGLKAEVYTTALGGDRGYVRFVELPKAAQKAIGEVLTFEVESTLPTELDAPVMDHRILRHARDDDHISILAGVADVDEVRDRIGLVTRGVGAEPQRVGLGALPLANLISVCPELSASPEPLALIELGEHTSDVLILKGGEPRMVRTLSRGVAGLPHDAQNLAREVRQTLAAWRVHDGTAVARMFFVGVGRNVAGLDAFLQSELTVPIEDLPALELDVPAELQPHVPAGAKALAIALSADRRVRDLDLRQGSLQAQQSYQFLREKTPLLAGLAAAIFVSFGFSAFAELRALERETASLEAQLEASAAQNLGEATRDPTVADALLQDIVAGRSDDPLPEVDGFDLMVALSERIPPEIKHDITKFDFNKGKLNLDGVVDKIGEADAVMTALEAHPCFRDVKRVSTSQLKENRQKYKLELTVRCGPEEKKKKKRPAGAPGGGN